MINDCASVGETLLRYMPLDIERTHIKRTRDLWSKTFSITYAVLKAKGDVYHANYLLQDCYLASRLGKKPLVGYSMGSDLRVYLRHWLWGRLIRHNLKHCDRIIVSTPDLVSMARPFRDDVGYLPPPIDPELFHSKPFVEHSGEKRVLIASNSNWQGKGTNLAIKALSRLRNKIDVSIIEHGSDFEKTVELASSLGLKINVLPKMPHERMSEYYWNADVVIDQFLVGCPGMTALEAIACGRPVVTYVSSAYPEYEVFEPKDTNSEERIAEAVREACTNGGILKKQQEYIDATHRIDVAVRKLTDIYESVIKH